MSGTRRTSQFSRRGGGGGSFVPFNTPVVIMEIVKGEAPPKDGRWDIDSEKAEQYAHIKAITTADILNNDGTIQVPRGTNIKVLAYTEGENARTIDNLEQPTGNQPYITVGDTLNLSRCSIRARKIEGSDEMDVVLHTNRMNYGLTQANTYQPLHPEKYFALSPEEQVNPENPDADVYAKGGVFSGMMVALPAGKNADGKEFQSIIVVDDAAAQEVDGLDGVKAILADQQENAYSRVGVNGVAVSLYRKPGPDVDPSDLGNRISAVVMAPDRKGEDGVYRPQTPDDVFSSDSEIVKNIESGDYIVTAMPAKRFQLPGSKLPSAKDNLLGDMSQLFAVLDPDAMTLDYNNPGFRRGYVIASCSVASFDEAGQHIADADAQGQLMTRVRGALTPSGQAAHEIRVGQAYAWTVEMYDNKPFSTLEVAKAVGDAYAAKGVGNSIAEQKRALSEASSAAVKKFGGIGTPNRPTESPHATWDTDVITPVTPAEYRQAIIAGFDHERSVYKTMVEEQTARVPQLEERKENDKGAPSP